MFHRVIALWIAAFALPLAGCGGGSGGGDLNTSPAQPDGQSEPTFDTTEFRRNYGLDSLNSLDAYEAGLSGDGVTVAVIDSGIDRNHFDLDANISPRSTNVVGNDTDVQDEDGHGTWVAGIIAAEKNNQGTHGVAFDSSLLAVRADSPGSCDDECTFADRDIAAGIDYAVANGAKIVNISLGGDNPPTERLQNAMRAAVNNGALIVLSAGNGDPDGAEMPSGFAKFAADPTVKGRILIAGAVDRNNAIAQFSNRAGTPNTQDIFLVAPGVAIRTTDITGAAGAGAGNEAIVDGTSFSAPHVAGALALLLENFPNLSAAEIADILLESAADLGVAGDDAVFGRGLVDLAAAIAPTGTLSVQTADAAPLPLDGALMPGPAMGDSFAAGFSDTLAFDGRGRAYRAFLDRRVAAPYPRFDLHSAARQRQARADMTLRPAPHHTLRVGFDPRAFARPHITPLEEIGAREDRAASFAYDAAVGRDTRLSISGGGLLDLGVGPAPADKGAALAWHGGGPAAALTGNAQRGALTHRLTPHLTIGAAMFRGEHRGSLVQTPLDRSGGAISLSWRWSTVARLAIEFGTVREDDSLLGTTGTGAFTGIEGARTRYIQVEGELALGDWHLYGAASRSRTTAKLSETSLFENFSSLTARRRGVMLVNKRFEDRGHRFGVSVFQPLTVEEGTAAVTVTGGVHEPRSRLERRLIDLAPAAQETTLEVFYRFGGWAAGDVQANFIYRRNPDNMMATGNDVGIFVAFKAPL